MTVSDLANTVNSYEYMCIHYAADEEKIGHPKDFLGINDNIGFIDLQKKAVNGEIKTCIFAYVMPF